MKEFPRKLRINTQLQRELAALIHEELTDPRIAGISITHVEASPDLRNATILVSSLKSDDDLAKGVKALNGAAPVLRRGLGGRLKLRRVPALSFRADAQLRNADRLSVMIRDAVVSDSGHARDRGDGGESNDS